MNQIKRANHYETSGGEQVEVVEDLKSEVVLLKERIDRLASRQSGRARLPCVDC